MITTIDFETYGIKARPDYPPKPVGVAIKHGSDPSKYYAFAHPTGNNTHTIEQVRELLRDIWRSSDKLLFHNASFDLAVAERHFWLVWPCDSRIHDTLVLAFLHDPRARRLDLKGLAEDILGDPPEERDTLHDWIRDNVRLYANGRVHVGTDKPKGTRAVPASQTGAYIAYAPVSLVSRYAIGDTDRTYKLYKHFTKKSYWIPKKWYREVEIPILRIKTRAEEHGIRLHRNRLNKMQFVFQSQLKHVDYMLNKKLDIKNKINWRSPAELVSAFDNSPYMLNWKYTEKGNPKTDVASMRKYLAAYPDLLDLFEQRSVLNHYLTGFINPWLERDTERLYTTYNTVRTGEYGTRTGRFSSSNPNLENISANPEENVNGAVLQRLQKIFEDVYSYKFRGLRDAFLADKYAELLGRDYKQQELRILAHWENAALVEAYRQNPLLNFHEHTSRELQKIGVDVPHKHVKIVVFMTIYGAGLTRIGESIGADKEQARIIQNAVFDVMPGVKNLDRKLKDAGELVTWAGRYYETEPKQYVNGRLRSFEYKLLNILIQGSAADCTKRALVNMDQALSPDDYRMQLQEHDEIVGSAYGDCDKTMLTIKECMEDVNFRIPMLTDGKRGKSWARMKPTTI